jgi:hypothetical protein
VSGKPSSAVQRRQNRINSFTRCRVNKNGYSTCTAEPTDPRRPLTHPSLISRLQNVIAQSQKWLLLSLLASILIEWLGMLFWWPEQGLEHSRQMLVNELHYLSSDFQHSWLTHQPVQFAKDLSDR